MSAISPDLQDLRERVEDLSPHPDNKRRGNIEMIKSSLLHFGQVRPIVTTDDGVIVAGNHTFKAALALGWDEIAAVRVTMSEDEAEAYLLMDNRSSDTATWDDVGLLEVLESMQLKDMLQYTGFTPDDLEDLQSALDAVAETEEEEFSGDFAEPEDETAARWEGREEGRNREVVFLLPHADFETFMENVTKLKKLYVEDSAARCIFLAVQQSVSQYEMGPEPVGEPTIP